MSRTLFDLGPDIMKGCIKHKYIRTKTQTLNLIDNYR